MPKMIGIIDINGFEHGNRVYSTEDSSPTVTARDYKDPLKILDMGKVKNIIADKTRQDKTRQDRIAA